MSETPTWGQWTNQWWDGERWRTDPIPPRGPWTGTMLGITFTPHIGDQPNLLQRLCGRWFLGIKWTKQSPEDRG